MEGKTADAALMKTCEALMKTCEALMKTCAPCHSDRQQDCQCSRFRLHSVRAPLKGVDASMSGSSANFANSDFLDEAFGRDG
jgi:hypothetical protein